MIFEKVTLKLDLKQTEENEFLRSFCKEYMSDKHSSNKSFMKRMKDDIERRRGKSESLDRAEKRYRRSKYGSLSKQRVCMMV